MTIRLHLAGEHGPISGMSKGLSIGLNVENLGTAMAELKKKGATLPPHMIEDGPLRIAFSADPDSNPLYFCQTQY